MKISRQRAKELIENSGGKFFTVWFRKRTDNTLRKLTGRLGVKKFLKGGELSFDPEEKNLIMVAEFLSAPIEGKQFNFGIQYRSINIDGIIMLQIQGEKFELIKN